MKTILIVICFCAVAFAQPSGGGVYPPPNKPACTATRTTNCSVTADSAGAVSVGTSVVDPVTGITAPNLTAGTTKPTTCTAPSRFTDLVTGIEYVCIQSAYYRTDGQPDVFVDSVGGNDANTGLSPAQAKATIAGALAVLSPGQRLGLARGSNWAEYLYRPYGVPPVVYGTGAEPVYSAAVSEVAVMGDSITLLNQSIDANNSWQYDEGYWMWAEYAANGMGGALPFVNLGVSGNTTTQMEARFAADILARNSSHIAILGGINDINTSVASATIIAKLQAMYDVVPKDRQLIVMTVMPSIVYVGTGAKQAVYDAVNTFIRAYAAANPWRVTLADTALSTRGANDYTACSGCLKDDVHLSAKGAALAGQTLGAAILARMIPTPSPWTFAAGSFLQNPTMTGTAGTKTGAGVTGSVATSWNVTSDATVVAAKVARADGVSGEWQEVTATGTAGQTVTLQQTAIAGAALDDQLQLAVELVPVGDWSGVGGIAAHLVQMGQGWASIAMRKATGATHNLATNPGNGYFVTIPYTVHGVSVTSMQVKIILTLHLANGGSATFRVGRVEIRKLN